MGVLYDYFRACDDAAVVVLMDVSEGGGPTVRKGEEPGIDAVDAKGIDPTINLGKLVALALDEPWRVDLVGSKLVWPAGAQTDHEYEGPWVEVLSNRVRDALSEIADRRISELAARWSQIEEFAHYSEIGPDTMLPVLTELVGLARRARAANDGFYCWSCL